MAQGEPIRKRAGGGAGQGSGSGKAAPREIPDKLYFRIGDVAKLCEVPAYVLRFWEGEFPQLKPNKGGTGQRLYRRRDVEMALRIKTLLYDEGYTIPGARQAFKAELRTGKDPEPGAPTPAAPGNSVDSQPLIALRQELRELHAMLSRPAANRTAVQPIRTPAPPPEKPALPPPTPFPGPRLMAMKPRSPAESTNLFPGLFGPDDTAS